MRIKSSLSRSITLFFLGSSLVSAHSPRVLTDWQKPLLPVEVNTDMSSSRGQPPTANEAPDVPIMSDALSIQRDVSIFAEFVRGSETVSKRLENYNKNTTVLAPLNSAIKSLPRKPWEDPDDSVNSKDWFSGGTGEKRAAENLERFVMAHMVPSSPFKENEKVETMGGRTIWWETTEGGVIKIFPDGIEVKEVKNSVPNGQIWTIEGVINYSI